MNIAVTNHCTRSCPFCYQSQIMSRADLDGTVEMPVEGFEQVLRFIERSGDETLNFVGGEPTLHRQFPTLLQRVDESTQIRQALLFTNGIFNRKVLDAITRHSRKLLISVNVLAPEEESPARLEAVNKVFVQLRQRKMRFDLSYVVHRPDFSWEFLLDYVDRFEIPAVRWALAYPVVPGASFVRAGDLQTAGTRVVEMLQALNQRGVRTYVDCPLPYCMFDDEQMGYVSRQGLSVINWGYCGLTLEVNPDLTVKACPSQLESERVPLSHFESMAEMERFFFSRMSPYKGAHRLFDDCEDCRYFQQGRCQGGCLAYSREVFSRLDLTRVDTLTAEALAPEWRLRPLEHLTLRREAGKTLLASAISSQVEPEELDTEGLRLWTQIESGTDVAGLCRSHSQEDQQRILDFVRHLQRIGFVDLVPPTAEVRG